MRAGEQQHQPHTDPVPPGGQGRCDPPARAPDPPPPALAVVVVGWLEAAEQVLAAGASAQDLQDSLGMAGREGNLG